MANLVNKILSILNNGKISPLILDEFSMYEVNLIENLSNSAIDSKFKDEIIAKYISLKNINQSLCRYNKLQEKNYLMDAKEEKDYIEDIILKGGIVYYHYVWQSENSENTCDVCKELDGKIFDFYDKIPERPHPNCKCIVKPVKKEVEDFQPENSSQQNTTQDKKQKSLESSKSEISTKKWIKPCNGPIVGHYGEVRSTHIHNGIDIAVPIGTPIKTVADGTVYYAGANDPKGYGQYVIITHNVNGKIITSEYGHLSSWNVHIGQQVKQGQVIANSGNTGHSHGPHLHLTIREGRYKGTPVNPNIYVNY